MSNHIKLTFDVDDASSTSSSEDANEILIENITSHRTNGKHTDYQVQVFDGKRMRKTWVSEKDLRNCDEILAVYWKNTNSSTSKNTRSSVMQVERNAIDTTDVKSTSKSTSKSKSRKMEKMDTEDEVKQELDTDVELCDPFVSMSVKRKAVSTNQMEDTDDDEPVRKKPKINDDDLVAEIENILECVPGDPNQYKIKWVGSKVPTWIDEDDFIDTDILKEFRLYQKNRLDSNLTRRAYIYCRTSRRNGDKEVSLFDQEKYCLEFAKKNNIDIIGVYRDNGVSAKDMKNQFCLNFICDRIKKGECIMFYDVSRFSRSMLQALERLEHLRKNVGAIAHACHDGLTWNNIATSRNSFRQNLSNSQLHSEVISEKVKSAIEFRRERGDHIGYVPYGYTTNIIGDSRQLVTNKDEQTVINLIIRESMGIVADRFGGMSMSTTKTSGKIRKGRAKKTKIDTTNATAIRRLREKMSEFTPGEYRAIANAVNAKHKNRQNKPFTWLSIKKILQRWGDN